MKRLQIADRRSGYARLRYASPGFTSRACRATVSVEALGRSRKLVERRVHRSLKGEVGSLISPISYFVFPISSFLSFFLLSLFTPSMLTANDWEGVTGGGDGTSWLCDCNWSGGMGPSGALDFENDPLPLVPQCIQLGGMTHNISRFDMNSTITYTLNDGTLDLSGGSSLVASVGFFNCISICNNSGGNRLIIGDPCKKQ